MGAPELGGQGCRPLQAQAITRLAARQAVCAVPRDLALPTLSFVGPLDHFDVLPRRPGTQRLKAAHVLVMGLNVRVDIHYCGQKALLAQNPQGFERAGPTTGMQQKRRARHAY